MRVTGLTTAQTTAQTTPVTSPATSPLGRRGVALLVVIALMAVSAALMISATDLVRLESQTARSDAERHIASVAADAELWTTVAGLDARIVRTMPLGQPATTTRVTGALTLITAVDRVDTSTVWIVATAAVRNRANVARHRVGITLLIPHDPADSVLYPLRERAWAELY